VRIRPNIFLVSSLLLTFGLLWLLPSTIKSVQSTDTMIRIAGLAFLTIIIVALIVTWTGVAAGTRVAWVIMVVIVWVWALPAMAWPLFTHPRVLLSLSDLREWVATAWRGVHFARTSLMSTVIFLLMLIGLILPVRAFLRLGKPKYLVPSAKESLRAMEITLIGIGIILGVVLLAFQFKILTEPPHDSGYGTALKDCEAIPEQMEQFLSPEEMDPDGIQIETVVGSKSEKNLKPLIAYISAQKKKDFGTLVAALTAVDELANQRQKAIQFVKVLLPYKDALRDESAPYSVIVFVHYGLKRPSRLSSPTRAKLGNLVKQLDTAAQAAQFDSGECPANYLDGHINIYPLALENTFWHQLVEFPSSKNAPIMEIRFVGLRGVFRYLLDEMTARTGDTFVHLDGESL
jgi:hypothetical protein